MLVSKKFLLIGALVLAALVIARSGSAPAATQWEPIGPDGGDRYELKISPYDNQTLFVYGSGGIHKSIDAAASWDSVSTPEMEKMNSILSLDFDLLYPQTIFLGGTSRGMWKSVDGGDTWIEVNNGIPEVSALLGRHVPTNSVVISPTGAVFAGSSNPSAFADPEAAWIYCSTDGGITWQGMDSGIDILSVEPLTQTENVLLSKDVEGQIWAMVYGGGIFRLEHGAWISHNGNLPASALRGTHLAHHPTKTGNLCLGTEDGWVYQSSDYGRTWTSLTLPVELDGLPVLPLVYFVGMDPNNEDAIFVRANDNYGSNEQPLFIPRGDQTAGNGLYYSFDRGVSWVRYPVFLFRITIDPTEVVSGLLPGVGDVVRSKVAYITTGGYSCVNKSTDGQSNYSTAVTGLDNVLVNTVWAHPNPPAPYASVIIGGAESGLYLSEDGASPTWKRQASTTGSMYTWSFAANYQDPNEAFYSTGNPAFNFTSERGVYVTDLSCLESVESSCPPGQQLLSDTGVWKVVTTPVHPSRVYAACQEAGVLYSVDSGQNWLSLNDGLTLPESVTDLILTADGSPMFASTRSSNGSETLPGPDQWWPAWGEAGAIYSFDSGQQQWAKLSGVDVAVIGLALDTANNVLYAATVQGIFRSEDNGDTFQQYVWDEMFTDILVDPGRDGVIFASSFNGVYRALDGGLGWELMNTGLESYETNQLAIDTGTGIVYLASSGGSIFRLPPDASPQPDISLDVSAIDFGAVPIGFMSEAFVTITNHGEADLVVDSIVPDHGDISIVESFPQTLAPWTTSKVTVQFAPTAEQTVNAFAVITSDDPDTPTVSLPVDGEGVPPIEPIPDVKVNGSDGPLTIDAGTTVNVTIDIPAGDYLGQPAEFWISVDTPLGLQWFVEGTGWVLSVTPIPFNTGGTISSFSIPIDMGSELLVGDYDFQCSVDNIINGTFDPVWQDMLSLTIQSVIPPVPDLKLNGQDGPLTLTYGTQATLFVALTANDYLGQPAEFWISAQTPFGTYWFVEGSGWVESITPVAYKADGTIGDLDFSIGMGSVLPAGSYVYEFSVDNIVNGTLDQVWFDTLDLTIEAAADPIPDIMVTGQDGPMSQIFSPAVSLNVSLSPGGYQGEPAELWISVQTPVGQYWFVAGSGWVPSTTPVLGINTVIADINHPINLGSRLPKGSYQFEFTVDNVVNGEFDSVWTDSVSMSVQ